MLLKTFLWHWVISIVAALLYVAAIDVDSKFDSKLLYLVNFIAVGFLYVWSGYLSTTGKVSWYHYFAVAIIGLLLWTYCFITYSKVDPYKLTGGPNIWAFYEVYVLMKSNLKEFTSELSLNDRRIVDDVLNFIMPVLISALQLLGGKWKLEKLTNVANDN